MRQRPGLEENISRVDIYEQEIRYVAGAGKRATAGMQEIEQHMSMVDTYVHHGSNENT
jgi:hypothetical protein